MHAGGLIFVSGQIPALADGTLVTGSIAEQTTACLEGLKHILEAAGSSIAKVTKVGCWISVSISGSLWVSWRAFLTRLCGLGQRLHHVDGELRRDERRV